MHLNIQIQTPITAQHGGLFISRGIGTHPTRAIDSYELIYVDQGILGLFEADQHLTIHAGESLLLYPDRLHGGILPYSPELRFYWIHFLLDPQTSSDGSSIMIPQIKQIERPQRLKALWHLFLDDQAGNSGLFDSAAYLIQLMLQEVCMQNNTGKPITDNPMVNQTRTYIASHFHGSISTIDIAEFLGVNPDYLGRIFKQETGTTITEAIHTIRLSHAQNNLLHAPLNINEIAEQSGFNDAGYFRRLFKRKTGMTPAAYRKTFSKININTI